MPIREFFRHHWPTVTIAVTAAAFALAAVVMFSSMPPHFVNLWPNNRLDELLPWTWAAARQQQQRAAA